LCPILAVAATSLARVRYYTPDQIAGYDQGTWLTAVQLGDVVLFIDYFGFPCARDWLARAARHGACVVEDACQALLTATVGENADFVLFSPRKFLGVADGGILSARGRRPLPSIDWKTAPGDWWRASMEAATRRAAFDRGGSDRGWHEQFQRAEATAPIGPFRMSDRSRAALANQFDYRQIAARRRENYRYLCAKLPDFALFSDLDEGVVPLGFPALFENRDRVRRALFAEEVFPPIHWQIDSGVPVEFDASHRLAARILTLPCDQRYGVEVMERMAGIVKGVARPCTDI
jgi:dTDP-4-amino-4,6-dideoxygalactose transaminase